MKRFLRGLFFGGLFLCGSLFSHSTLYALSGQGGLTVSPAFQDITLNQKDRKTDFSVSLTNETSVPMTLRLSAYDFGSLDESGGVAFLGASSDLAKKYALAAWMHPEKDSVMLESNETAKVLVTIENSDLLSPGGHYGALMFQVVDDTTGVTDTPVNDISVKQMFSTLVFVKKVGGEIYDLKLRNQKYMSHLLQFQRRLDVRFQNDSNVHVVPRGIAVIRDPLGRVVSKGIINQESTIILPETARSYPVLLASQAWIFMPGRYNLEVDYRYDGKDDFSTTVIQFDFIPLPATLGCLALVAIFGWYVVRRRRKMGEYKASSAFPKTAHKND